MAKHFSLFTEHRLIYFSPGSPETGGGDEAPEAEEGVENGVEALKQAEALVDVEAAKTKMGELVKDAEANALKDAAEVQNRLLQAGDLAYGEKKAGEVMDKQALDEVNAMFKPALDMYDLQFADDNNDGKLELVAGAPATKSEALQNQLKDAAREMQSGDPAKMFAALFKIFGTLQQFVDAAKDGSLDDSFESTRSKQTRERAERRNKLMEDLDGKDVDTVLAEKETAKQTADNKVKQLETSDIPTQKTKIEDMRKKLTEEKGKETKDEAGIRALEEQIQTEEQNLKTMETNLEAAKKEADALQSDIDDLKDLKEKTDLMKDTVRDTVKAAGQVYANSPKPELKALGQAMINADVTMTKDLKLKVTAGGGAFGEKVRSAMEQAGVDAEKIPSDADMGLNAEGVIVAMESFTQFLGVDMNTEVKEQQKSDVIAALEQGYTGDELQAYMDVIEADGAWLDSEIDGRVNERVFKNGTIYSQSKSSPTTVAVFNAETGSWEDRADQYFNGTSLVDLPGADESERNRLHTFDSSGESREWRQKTAKEIHVDLDEIGPLPQEADDALGEPNTWQNDGTDEYFFDGKQALYKQSVDGGKAKVLNLDEFSKDNEKWEDVDPVNQYFNGITLTGLPEPDDAAKRGRTHKYEKSGEGRELKPKTDIQIADDINWDKPPFETAVSNAAQKEGQWEAYGTKKGAIFVDGQLYDHTPGGDFWVLDLDKFKNTGRVEWKEPSEFIDKDGNKVPKPNRSVSSFNPETHEWESNESKAVDNLPGATADEKEGLKGLLEATDWTENPKYTDYEGIRVGDKIYVQAKTNPDELWVADLKNLTTYKGEKGKYFNGSEVKNVPAESRRGPYNEETHEWGEISAEQAESRGEKRFKDGAQILNANPESTKEGDVWHVNLSYDWNDLQFQFNKTTQQWEYTHEDEGKFVPVSVTVDQIDPDFSYWGADSTARAEAKALLAKLRPINSRYEDG